MANDTPRLIALGIASLTILKTLNKSFGRRGKSSESIILVCDYSAYTIPLGYIFKAIEKNGLIVFNGEIILSFITQQFDQPIDEISKGWKTICEFTFQHHVPLKLTENLPIIDGWVYVNNDKVEFC